MSFGVGNEIEGKVRIDALVDSILAEQSRRRHGDLRRQRRPRTLDASASLARRAGRSPSRATLPSSFLVPGANGAPLPDQLAYFSSRGGEIAKPDIATPGMAYSTVPLWNAGDEVEQGTSMAAPHAAGLAALLVSGLAHEKKPVDASAVRQALMVTAAPTAGMTYLDEGTGIPDVGRAWGWLEEAHAVAPIEVRAIGPGNVHRRRSGAPRLPRMTPCRPSS